MLALGLVGACAIAGLRDAKLLFVPALAIILTLALMVGFLRDMLRNRRYPPGADGCVEAVAARWIGPFDECGINGSAACDAPARPPDRFARPALVSLVVVATLGYSAASLVVRGNGLAGAQLASLLWILAILVVWSFQSQHPHIVNVRVDAGGIALTRVASGEHLSNLPWVDAVLVQEIRVDRTTRLIVLNDRCDRTACLVFSYGNAALVPALERFRATRPSAA